MRAKFFTPAVCAAVMLTISFCGCSNNANEPYEMPSDSSSVESIVVNSSEESSDSSEESFDSSEQSTDSSEQSTASSDTSLGESIGSDPESDSEWGPYEPYREIWVDDEFLKTVEEDTLNVLVVLYSNEEATRAEYKEKYPKIADNPYYWTDFLCNKNEQLVREFLSDYNIAYEDIGKLLTSADIYGELEKGTISLMLKDPRVSEIIYTTGGGPLDDL